MRFCPSLQLDEVMNLSLSAFNFAQCVAPGRCPELLVERVGKAINTTELCLVLLLLYLLFTILFEVGIRTHFPDGETEAESTKRL